MSGAGPGLHVLVTQAACALAEALLPEYTELGVVRVPLRQAHVFAAGRVDAWSAWHDQPRRVHELVGRLLRLRHNELGSVGRFLHSARQAALRGDGPYTLEPNARAQDAEFVLPRHGQDPLQLAEHLLDEADEQSQRGRTAGPMASDGLYTFGLQGRSTVRVPLLDSGEFATLHAPAVTISEDFAVSKHDLLALADELDGLGDKKPWRRVVIEKLFLGLKDDRDLNVEVLELRNGRLTTLSAPTGVGKTVLIQLVAILLARRGVPVAIVLGTIKDALKLSEDLGEQARAISDPLTSIRCTALVSAGRVYEQAVDAARGENWERFDRLAYGCTLSSWREDGPLPENGAEPCARLYQSRDDNSSEAPRRAKRHTCPLIANCDRFKSIREAVNADVIITNHHNFMLGTCETPMVARGTPYGRMSVMEFVMRRCPVVLVDEIDQLQSSMFDSSARELVLADNTGTAGSQPLAQLDQQRSRLPPAQDRDVAPSLSRTRLFSDQLLNYVLDGELQLDSSFGRSEHDDRDSSGWHIPGAHDHWLIHYLLGEEPLEQGYSEQVYSRFNALFPDSKQSDTSLPEGPLRDVALLLRNLVSDFSGFDRLRETKNALVPLVSGLLRQTRQHRGAASDDAPVFNFREEGDTHHLQRELVNALLVRTWLGALRQSLTALTYALGAHDIELAASEALQLQLGNFVQHATIPFGSLGYLLLGMKVDRDGGGCDRGRLSAQVLAGDPHNTVRGLADIVALSAVGTRRIVIGLSATSFFPGAAREHILTEPTYAMTDAARGTFKAAAGVTLVEGRAVHIGGQKEHDKPDILRTLGKNLWHQQLDAHLRTLQAKDPERERCLLVANSYKQAALLATGVAEGAARSNWVAVVVPKDPLRRTAPIPPGVVSVTVDQLETLPRDYPSVKVCVAPIDLVSRGLNILIPKTSRSALASIWVCVRPVLQVNAPAEILASMNAYALMDGNHASRVDPAGVLALQRGAARKRLQKLLAADPRFTRLPQQLKAEAIAGLMVKLIQLGGRARRGGTDMGMFLVDNAFHDPALGSDLGALLRYFHTALSARQRASLARIYGSTLEALLEFAGVALRDEESTS